MKNMTQYEGDAQKEIFRWADDAQIMYPELALLYAVPNGGSRNKLEARNLKLQGVKRGVPDMCLPVARDGYHGLYVELKRCTRSKTSPQQDEWIARLKEQGYMVCVAYGAQGGVDVIERYLRA